MKNMKKVIAAIGLVSVLAACQNEDDGTNTADVSTDDVADMVALSLSENSSGMTAAVDESSDISASEADGRESGRTVGCGATSSVSWERTSPSGTLITYDYSVSYEYIAVCGEDSVPASISFEHQYDGYFDAPRMASTNSGSGAWEAVETSPSVYTYNGYYSRTGTFESKIRNKTTTESDVEIEVNDLTYNADTHEVEGGEGTVHISGTVSGKGSFSYDGEITFGSGGTATLVINGNIYQINVVTGDVE